MTDNLSSYSPLQLASDSIGAGPDLVILHGLFGDGENWRNQAKKLAADFTVHSLDMRNHGASPHASQISYPAMAADVRRTCQSLGVQEFAENIDDKHTRAFLLKNLQRINNGDYQLRINLDAIISCYDEIAAAVPANPTAPRPGPTLFIKGSESDYLQTDDRATILGLFPNATLKTIGGAGHWPQSEKPDIVYRVINRFLHD